MGRLRSIEKIERHSPINLAHVEGLTDPIPLYLNPRLNDLPPDQLDRFINYLGFHANTVTIGLGNNYPLLGQIDNTSGRLWLFDDIFQNWQDFPDLIKILGYNRYLLNKGGGIGTSDLQGGSLGTPGLPDWRHLSANHGIFGLREALTEKDAYETLTEREVTFPLISQPGEFETLNYQTRDILAIFRVRKVCLKDDLGVPSGINLTPESHGYSAEVDDIRAVDPRFPELVRVIYAASSRLNIYSAKELIYSNPKKVIQLLREDVSYNYFYRKIPLGLSNADFMDLFALRCTDILLANSLIEDGHKHVSSQTSEPLYPAIALSYRHPQNYLTIGDSYDFEHYISSDSPNYQNLKQAIPGNLLTFKQGIKHLLSVTAKIDSRLGTNSTVTLLRNLLTHPIKDVQDFYRLYRTIDRAGELSAFSIAPIISDEALSRTLARMVRSQRDIDSSLDEEWTKLLNYLERNTSSKYANH